MRRDESQRLAAYREALARDSAREAVLREVIDKADEVLDDFRAEVEDRAAAPSSAVVDAPAIATVAWVSEAHPRLALPGAPGGRRLPHELLDETLDDRGLVVWGWVRAAGFAPLVEDIAKGYGVTIAMLVGRRRQPQIAHARHELWLRVAVLRSEASLVELGRVFRVHVGSIRHGIGVAMSLHPCPDCGGVVVFDGDRVACTIGPDTSGEEHRAGNACSRYSTIREALERRRRALKVRR